MPRWPLAFCQACGRKAPTMEVTFRQNVGALVMHFHRSVNGDFCKPCIQKYFWHMTLITLFLGWWGVISFFFTLFILPANVFVYLGAKRELDGYWHGGRSNG